jgi:hypothetical protein
VLNSPALDEAVKPLQSRGDFGPRDICKKIWSFPIPAYTAENETHKKLAVLGEDCSEATKEFLENAPPKLRDGNLGHLRRSIRERLTERFQEINRLTRSVLAGS